MGLFDKMFGGGEQYPELESEHYAMTRVNEVRPQLETLAGEVKDRLEVVPAEHAAYVFIGKPPKTFGLAWIHDGQVSSFKTLVEERGVAPPILEQLVDRLRGAYQKSADAPRFQTSVGGREVTVTPAAELEAEVHRLIEAVTR